MIPGLNIELSEEQEEAIKSYIKDNYLSKRFYKKLEETNEHLSERVEELELMKNDYTAQKESMESLQKKYDSLKETSEKEKANYESSLQRVKIDYAVNDRLTREGARNVRVILPLLDYGKLTMDEKGQLIGLEDQLKSLKSSEDTKFLFYDQNFKSDTENLPRNVSSSFSDKKAEKPKDPMSDLLSQIARNNRPDLFSR